MDKPHIIEKVETIRMELPDGRMIEGPRGLLLNDFLSLLEPELNSPLMGGIIDNELKELSFSVNNDVDGRPVTLSTANGWIIYRRSLVFLLAACFEELFPNLKLEVAHAMLSGGNVCYVTGDAAFDQASVEQLEALMHRKVEADLPIVRKNIPLHEARTLFEKTGKPEKLALLAYRKKDYLSTYTLEDYQDYHYGYLLPSTGKLQTFALEYDESERAIFLHFPKNGASSEVHLGKPSPKVMEMYNQSYDLKKRLGVNYLSSINRIIEQNQAQRLILVSEAMQNQRFIQIAQDIADHREDIRVVLIAGPSSSGKTTFSKRLSIELLAHGVIPIPVEMDNFFVNREDTPKDENGNYDFECLNAMNVPLMMDCVDRLIKGETVQLPHFNFKAGKSEPGETLKLSENEVLILEGIHGLNPDLLSNIPANKTYRIFIAPLTQINLDRYSRVSTVDVRLLRRIVRDFRDRGSSAQETIARWASVRAGEEKNIIPFQHLADAYVDSSLPYEIAALKPLAEAALRMVPYGTEEYIEAKRLLSLLDWASPLDHSLIPANSILAEFIGGSNLKNYTVWQ